MRRCFLQDADVGLAVKVVAPAREEEASETPIDGTHVQGAGAPKIITAAPQQASTSPCVTCLKCCLDARILIGLPSVEDSHSFTTG